ncbi:hypothetical protein [Altericista sp. CCNU0014]|uniref:hypothetical protein n=1 Tax=Altericista sp. CCNU0014 TaxID=3082949 RepID=UPI00384D1E22
MPTYNVSDVIEIIRTLSPEQKQELQRELPNVLAAVSEGTAAPAKSQNIGGVTITGSSQIDLNQIQAESGSNIAQNQTQAKLQNTDLKEALMLLENLKQAVTADNTLNPLAKEVVAEKIQAIQQEVQKPQPDKSLVDRAIMALKKGLAGVEELADPVMRVASLVAKAWIVIP